MKSTTNSFFRSFKTFYQLLFFFLHLFDFALQIGRRMLSRHQVVVVFMCLDELINQVVVLIIDRVFNTSLKILYVVKLGYSTCAFSSETLESIRNSDGISKRTRNRAKYALFFSSGTFSRHHFNIG